MKIGVLKETKPFETRVALTPEIVKQVIKNGFEVWIETEAGKLSSNSDKDYENAGAKIGTKAEIGASDVVLKVNSFSEEEVDILKDGIVTISFLYAYTIPSVVLAFNKKRISSFSMDAVPRILRT